MCMLLSTVGCERDRAADAADKPSASRPSAGRPTGLVAVIELPGGDNRLGSLRPAVDMIMPGGSAMLSNQMQTTLLELAGGSLDGADLGKPVRLIALDPSKHEAPFVVLVAETAKGSLTPADGAAVERAGGHALVGPPEVVHAAAGFALGDLLRRPPPTEPSATLYVRPLRAAFADDIAGLREEMSSMSDVMGENYSELMRAYFDMLELFAEQVDHVVLTPAVGGDGAGVRIQFVARAGSGLAAYARAQRPADLALLKRLPATEQAQYALVARFDAEPLAEYADAFIMSMMDAGKDADAARTAMRRAMQLFDGRMAMALSGLPLEPTGAMVGGLRGDGDADEVMQTMMKSFAAGSSMDIGGIKQTVELEPNALVYDGVAVWRSTTRTEVSDPNTAATTPASTTTAFGAVVGDLYVNVFGPAQNVGPAIDAARGKGPGAMLDETLSTRLHKAVEAGASAVLVVDLASFTGGSAPARAFTLAIGFEGDAMNVDLQLATP